MLLYLCFIKEHWNEVLEEIIKIETKRENLILLGDFNKHIGEVIEGNHSKTTEGGKLIKDLLRDDRYVLLNSLREKVKGGPFTRVDPADPNNDDKKSCLDLIIVSRSLVKYVESVEIDSQRRITPFHAINKRKTIYPDHFAVITKFKNLPMKKKRMKTIPKIKCWNTNKIGGWLKYQSLTEKNKTLEKVNCMTSDPEKIMTKIERELTRVKYESFGKVKYRENVCQIKI